MTDKEINNKCDGAICPHYRQCVLLQRKEQELKNEKEAARIDLEILNQACLDLRNELEEKEQEYQKLSMKYLDMNSILDDALINLSDVGKPQHALCELPFEIKKLKQQCEELKKELDTAKINYSNEMDYQRMYYQALEKIDNIVTSAGFGLDDKAILSLVKPILKIINEVKGE